jgi:hypothetical protein
VTADAATYPTRPPVQLTGEDGNVFAVIGRCRRAAVTDGWTREDIDRWMTAVQECPSYDHVLAFVTDTFTVS